MRKLDTSEPLFKFALCSGIMYSREV
jgi:hypothetical protein